MNDSMLIHGLTYLPVFVLLLHFSGFDDLLDDLPAIFSQLASLRLKAF